MIVDSKLSVNFGESRIKYILFIQKNKYGKTKYQVLGKKALLRRNTLGVFMTMLDHWNKLLGHVLSTINN